jgi:hypothetical protein
MFVRTTKRKNTDGSVVEYVQLAHNEWDKRKGQARARVLYSFGRRENVDVEGVRRLVRSLSGLLETDEAVQVQGELDGLGELDYLGSRPAGGGFLLRRLWEKLGLRSVVERRVRNRKFRADVEKAVFAMVANRALAPSSKWSIPEWVREDVALPDVEEVEAQHCYRAMDVLHECADELQRDVFSSVADVLNLEVDLLFLDTTSTYFETEEQSALKKQGFSKDRRPDLPQVVIGMAVTRDGIPVRVWTFPGNTNDSTTVEQVKADLQGWRLNRVVWVFDRGFTSEENLREFQKGGSHYIAGEKLRDGQAAHKQALSRQGRYKQVRDNVEVKEVVVGDGEARRRFVLVRNPEQKKRDEAKRKEALDRLRAEMQEMRGLSVRERDERYGALKAHATLGRYLTRDARGRPRVNRDKVREEQRLDGKYLLSTSDDTLSTAEVALGYKQLLNIEDAWRTLKTTLDLRPVYHRRDDRIETHVLLCWLALLLVRVIERATGESWARTRRTLNRLTLGAFRGDTGDVQRYATPSQPQLALFKAVGVDPPPRFHCITPTHRA